MPRRCGWCSIRKSSLTTICSTSFSRPTIPTQLNRQGGDVGTQYRSAIFPQSDEQRVAAEAAIARANAEQGGRVVTTIEPNAPWYPAEDYHQDYFEREGARNPYCQAVIAPKLQKFRKSFQARLKNAGTVAAN